MKSPVQQYDNGLRIKVIVHVLSEKSKDKKVYSLEFSKLNTQVNLT